MWWEHEQPQEVRTRSNVVRWYPKAGKLQVARPDWTDTDGQVKSGKTVTVDIEAIRQAGEGQNAAAILQAVIDMLY